MKLPRSFWSLALTAGALISVSFIGFMASRPVNTGIDWAVFCFSLTVLLVGGVVLFGTLIREAVARCGYTEGAAKIFTHLIGVGFCASAACLLGFAGVSLALITFHPGPASASVYSERDRALSALGGAIFTVFFWPAQALTRLTGQVMPAWLSLLSCSLFYGVTLYGLVIFMRELLVRARGKRMA